MKLAYVAYDKRGQQATGAVEADDAVQAREMLRSDGLLVESLAPYEKGSLPRATRPAAARNPQGMRHLKALALWTRQMLVLVRFGTPVAQAMIAIEKQQPEGPWREVVTDLRERVEEGTPLSEAMAAHGATFDPIIRSLIAAGESSGQMDHILERVAEIARANLKMRQALTGALVYPCMLIMIGIAVTVLMLLGVVPRFAELFDSLGAPMPPTTKFMITLSEHLRVAWWMWAAGFAIAGVGLKFFVGQPAGRALLDKWIVRLPAIGTLTRSLATARITRVLGVLLESRVPLLKALDLAADSAGNLEYSALMRQVREAAGRGQQISSILTGSSLIGPSVVEAIRHGEENGQVGPILTDMTEFLEEENEMIMKSTLSLIEPSILIVLGLLVGGMALSLFIPMFDMAGLAGGGGG